MNVKGRCLKFHGGTTKADQKTATEEMSLLELIRGKLFIFRSRAIEKLDTH